MILIEEFLESIISQNIQPNSSSMSTILIGFGAKQPAWHFHDDEFLLPLPSKVKYSAVVLSFVPG